MKKHSDQNDKTLVELTLLGDETAYEELILRHQSSVMGTAFKVTHNKYSAEDAAQDAFTSAWINLSELREGEKFGSWVCAFAKNCARTLERRYHAAIPDMSFDASDYSGVSLDIAADFSCENDYGELHDAVEALSEKLRETVKLHYFEEKSVAEIAELLSVPVGTVKWRLSEGRKQLRKGYGVMEKTYDENESLLSRVMRQVEALKLWKLKSDKSGFEKDYCAVIANLEQLEDSKEKSSLLADTLLRGMWWLPGKKNDETMQQVKKAALDGHNDDVMMAVAENEFSGFYGEEKIKFMRETQIPYYRENGYTRTLAYVTFWLGFEYRSIGNYEEAIRLYEQVMAILTPKDVYYANAKAAIEGERLSIEASEDSAAVDFSPHVTGEHYRRIGNRLYFWEQPGYKSNYILNADNCLFWNMSWCDGIMYDERMTVGEEITSSDGKITLTYKMNDGVCDTPAGHFEGCSVYVCRGSFCGYTYSETWLCDGIGIVRQTVTRSDDITSDWELSVYNVDGKKGLLPFAAGNRWEYVMTTPDNIRRVKRKVAFEVTASDESSAVVAGIGFAVLYGYLDTWEGRMIEARNSYYKFITPDQVVLNDVSDVFKRAAELAGTKRQKVHTAVANKVMSRIFDTAPDTNPNYSKKGRWDFFERLVIRKNDGKISFFDAHDYSFEWKDTRNFGDEGDKLLYSFFLAILRDAAGCVWSDEWRDGYHYDEKKNGEYTTSNFNVRGGERVETPAGTFENCLRISFDYCAWDYFSGRSEFLFADGIGIVRFEHPYGDNKCAVWELTEYSGVGDGFFPTNDGLFRKYEVLDISKGWHGSVEYTFDEDETGTILYKDALGNQDRAEFEKCL